VISLKEDRWKKLAEKLAKELKERSGYDFTLKVYEEPYFRWACDRGRIKYPVKSSDGRELGLMFIDGERRHVYLDAKRKIKWPDDWIDPYVPFIDVVVSDCNSVAIKNYGRLDLDFLSLAYYCVELHTDWEMVEREDRWKMARFMPAVIKDIEVLLKLADGILTKHGIGKSEFNISSFNHLNYELSFKIRDMDDNEVIEEVLKRIEALTELKRRFGEWLPSEERKEYYENTMLFPEDPFRFKCYIPSVIDRSSGFSWRKYEGMRYICKWPFKIGDKEVDKKYKRVLKHELWDAESFKYYDLDGYRLRLAKKTEKSIKFLGRVNRKGWVIIDKAKVREEDLEGEDIVIAVDEKLEKLPKFPLEKIEFLKEDFPEMFKE